MASEPAPTANIALLIDADNASPDSLDPVLTVLAELGTVNISRAYGNWQKPALKGWSGIAHRHANEQQQQFDIPKGQSATDQDRQSVGKGRNVEIRVGVVGSRISNK